MLKFFLGQDIRYFINWFKQEVAYGFQGNYNEFSNDMRWMRHGINRKWEIFAIGKKKEKKYIRERQVKFFFFFHCVLPTALSEKMTLFFFLEISAEMNVIIYLFTHPVACSEHSNLLEKRAICTSFCSIFFYFYFCVYIVCNKDRLQIKVKRNVYERKR